LVPFPVTGPRPWSAGGCSRLRRRGRRRSGGDRKGTR
jgi:hypothetical protein